MLFKRLFTSSSALLHENPLGLPRTLPPPSIPRRGGLPQKRGIPNVKKVLVVSSGKGGVGKSTLAVNLAFTLAQRHSVNTPGHRFRVGILDLDVFGPSIPKLMGLEDVGEPKLTGSGAIVPLVNHGMQCMSMGFLLRPSPPPPSHNATSPPPSSASSSDASQSSSEKPAPSSQDLPIVWRGLMVQKAVQQLLFDVDWRTPAGDDAGGAGLDLLVIDTPPGTGDVHLTLGQLARIDGAVVVTTPQDVSLSDVRKGIAMFRKLDIPITGLILNTSHFLCPSCSTPHYIFGPPDAFHTVSRTLDVRELGELPLVPRVSTRGDAGVPFVLKTPDPREGGKVDTAEEKWREAFEGLVRKVEEGVFES